MTGTTTPLRLGIAGLGRAFSLMLPTFTADARVRLAGATDPHAAAGARFASDFDAPVYPSVEALCAAPDLDVIYIATPHQWHAEHACLAAAHGKHVLVEKPMAVTLAECTRMIDAARAAGVHLLVGPSHSYDAPILHLHQLLRRETWGPVGMIHASDYTDFLYRPRRPEELDVSQGGGVVHSQAAHQIDIVRLLGGGLVRSVRAHTGNWDPARPTVGAYSALLGFDQGAFCSATYSGYGHYDTDVLLDGIGESGLPKSPADYGAARRRLRAAADPAAEAALKAARNYGGAAWTMARPEGTAWHQHFGHIVVSCARADLRPTAKGIAVYGDEREDFIPIAPPVIPRTAVIDELVAAVRDDRPPLHDGLWSRATMEVCLAILESAAKRREVALNHQVAPRV